MNIAPYVNKINADAAIIAQAVAAERGVKALSVDTPSELVTALSGVLGDRVYNIELPQSPTYPAAAFRLDGSEPVMSDGYHVMQTDSYLLHVFAANIDGVGGLTESVAAVETALAAASWSIEIVDTAVMYDDELTVYVAMLELEFSVPALTSQTLPAAIVYPLDVSADESPYPNLTRQNLTQNIGITLITDSTETINDVRNDLFSALLGYQVTQDYEPVEYRNGSPVDGGGALTMWREQYHDGLYIEED